MKVAIGMILAFGLFGCASASVVQVSNDTFMILKEDHAGVFGSPSKMKAEVITEANAYAAKQGKVAVPISYQATPAGGFMQWPKYEYQFRVVNQDDPANASTALIPQETASRAPTNGPDYKPLSDWANSLNPPPPSKPKNTHCTSTANAHFGTVDTNCTEN